MKRLTTLTRILVGMALSCMVGSTFAADTTAPPFVPPNPENIPDNDFGKAVLRGQDIFLNTPIAANGFVGNNLNCVSCHMDASRRENASPMWAAYVLYPAYRSKNAHVNTLAERLQGCFTYSMNGKAPDYVRGKAVFEDNCVLCHGANGEGQHVADRMVFPALWGDNSYNWGAGMHSIPTAAAFIKVNMPLGMGYSLSDQEAWDVA